MEWLFLALNIALIAVPFVVASLLALLLAYGALAFYYRPLTAVRWVIWIFVLETVLIIKPSLPLGVQLYLPDLVFLLIGITGLLRLFSTRLQREHRLWLAFGAALLISFAIGTAKFGTAAGVEFRAFFYFWAGIWYLMVQPLSPADVDKIIRSWMFASAILVMAAGFRWLAMALGLDIVQYWNEGASSLRVFNAAETYFLGQAFVIGLYAHLNKTGPRWWKGLLSLLLICVVMLQHRTVWVLTAVSILILFVSAGRIRSRAVSTLLVAGMMGSALLLPLMMGGQLEPVNQSLVNSVAEVGRDNSTMTWRVQSWQTLLQQWAHDGPLVNLFGYPFGSGFVRHIAASQADLEASPHSQYVTVLLRAGAVGTLAMLALFYRAVAAMRRLENNEGARLVDSKLLLALLVGQLLYFITYSVSYIQLLPLGLSLVLMAQHPGRNLPEGKSASYRAPAWASRVRN